MIHGNRSHLPWLSEFLNIKIRNPRSLLPAPRSHNSHPLAGDNFITQPTQSTLGLSYAGPIVS
jgi:hypothetical protein